jgi:hypothetical protein
MKLPFINMSLTILLFFSLSCNKKNSKKEYVEATIAFAYNLGCKYEIVINDVGYWPVNLPEKHQIDNSGGDFYSLYIQYRFLGKDSLHTTNWAGGTKITPLSLPQIEILSILE